MQLKDILKYSFRIGGLALLVSLNSCSSTSSVVDSYLSALRSGNVEKMKKYMHPDWLSFRGTRNLLVTQNHYPDVEVKKFLSIENELYGSDRENVVWIEHSDSRYHEVLLKKDGSEWKIEGIDYCKSR